MILNDFCHKKYRFGLSKKNREVFTETKIKINLEI